MSALMTALGFLVPTLAGGANALFGKNEPDFTELPGPKIKQPAWAKEGTDFLTNLLRADIDHPTLDIAGLSENEQGAQDLLSKFVAGDTFEDPNTSQLWKGLRGEMDRQQEKGADAVRRRSQSGGMYRSSTGIGAEADFRADAANKSNTLLGGLYNQERDRNDPLKRITAGATYGSIPREVQNQRNAAAYQKKTQDLLAPLQLQAPLAQFQAGNLPYYQPQYVQNSTPMQRFFEGFGAVSPMATAMFAPQPKPPKQETDWLGGIAGIGTMAAGDQGAITALSKLWA